MLTMGFLNFFPTFLKAHRRLLVLVDVLNGDVAPLGSDVVLHVVDVPLDLQDLAVRVLHTCHSLREGVSLFLRFKDTKSLSSISSFFGKHWEF